MKLTQEYTAQVDCQRLRSSKGMVLRARITALHLLQLITVCHVTVTYRI